MQQKFLGVHQDESKWRMVEGGLLETYLLLLTLLQFTLYVEDFVCVCVL